jgi:hypothetical protein
MPIMKTVNHPSSVALVLVDLVNQFEFGDLLLRNFLLLVAPLARLNTAQPAGVPVIYVNDNFGPWQSEAGKLLAYYPLSAVRARNSCSRCYRP